MTQVVEHLPSEHKALSSKTNFAMKCTFQIKRQATENTFVDTFAKHVSENRFVYKRYKELLKFNNKKVNLILK
jgi:hypothetical protein